MNEPAFAGGRVRLGVVETVNADLDRAIALHLMDLEGAGDQFTPDIAATNVLLDAFGQVLSAESYATLIVIELYVVDEEGPELFQIAAVEGIENGCVQR